MNKRISVIFGLLFLLQLSSKGLCNPVDKTDSDDYLQDSQPDYNDDYPDEIEETNDNKPAIIDSSSEPEAEVKEFTQEAAPGENVVIACHVKNLKKKNVIMWYNGSLLIVQGDNTISLQKERIEVSPQKNLIIRNVNFNDDSSYNCRVLPEQINVKTFLHIKGPPRGMTIAHNKNNQDDITGTKLQYHTGDTNLKFDCVIAKSRPAAKITWNHNGNSIMEVNGKDKDIKITDDNALIIKTLHAAHAGEYECEASNEYGVLKAGFNIDVHFAPIFSKHRAYFNAEQDMDVALHCLYKASPAPEAIRWFKESKRIIDTDKYEITNDMQNHHDRTTLLIRKVTKDDLTKYHCEVENNLGVKRENITVGLLPTPAQYVNYKYINGILYTDWIIKSHQVLTELQFLYRNNATGWRSQTAVITNKNQVNPGEWNVQGSVPLEAGEWVINARAKNTEGWAVEAVNAAGHVIKLPNDVPVPEETTNSATKYSHSYVLGFATLIMMILRVAP